jgi:hypothetical protein
MCRSGAIRREIRGLHQVMKEQGPTLAAKAATEGEGRAGLKVAARDVPMVSAAPTVVFVLRRVLRRR